MSLTIMFMIIVFGLTLLNSVHSFSNGQAASYIIGQPDFKSVSKFGGGLATSSRTLYVPTGLTIDSSGNLWVGDLGDFRVLQYKPPFNVKGTAADIVLGQQNFTSTGGFYGGLTSILWPLALTSDSSGNLWVADFIQSRVLRFSPPFTNGMAANLVLGQPDFEAYLPLSPPSKQSLNRPTALAFDSVGDLWVADTTNNRVLRFSPPFTNGMSANLVLGQPNFVTTSGGVGDLRAQMIRPSGIAISNLDVWISDSSNNRILKFNPTCSESITLSSKFSLCLLAGDFTDGQAADVVLGQPNFETISALSPPSKQSLNRPTALAFDSVGDLWVADTINNRVLRFSPPVGYNAIIDYCDSSPFGYYDCVAFLNELFNVFADIVPNFYITNGQDADLVIGEPDFVTSDSYGTNANTLTAPGEIVFDSSNNLWVTDGMSNRILGYIP